MYDTFAAKWKNIYNSTCPVTVTKQKLVRKMPDKPRMTHSLKQACKKINMLNRQFLKKKSVVSEERYQKYKNKLTGILRYCEKKNHFTVLLEKNKGNMKETWKIINCLINKKKVSEQVTQQNLIAVRPKSQVANILLIVLIFFG